MFHPSLSTSGFQTRSVWSILVRTLEFDEHSPHLQWSVSGDIYFLTDCTFTKLISDLTQLLMIINLKTLKITLHFSSVKSGTSKEVVLDWVEPRPPVSRGGRAGRSREEMLCVSALTALASLAVVMVLGVSVSHNFWWGERRVRGDWGGRQRGQSQRAEGASTRLAAAAAGNIEESNSGYRPAILFHRQTNSLARLRLRFRNLFADLELFCVLLYSIDLVFQSDKILQLS